MKRPAGLDPAGRFYVNDPLGFFINSHVYGIMQ